MQELFSHSSPLETKLSDQAASSLTNAGDIGKFLVEQTRVQLTDHIGEVAFYFPRRVIHALPEAMTLDELMTRLNTPSPSESSPLVTIHLQDSPTEEKTDRTTTGTVVLPESFDAITVINQFLNEEEALLLLLGDPGTGKTCCIWQAVRERIDAFKPDMTSEQISECWLPLYQRFELLPFTSEQIERDIIPHCLQKKPGVVPPVHHPTEPWLAVVQGALILKILRVFNCVN